MFDAMLKTVFQQTRMKRYKQAALLTVVIICLSVTARAQTFSGVFLTGNGEGFVGGNIHLTLTGNQAYFQSTWFQYWTVGTSLEPVWKLQGLDIPFSLGSGTPGTWELGEFLGPTPNMGTIPPSEEPIDPGFHLPFYADGVRYSGSFTVPDGFEAALLVNSGVLQMQIYGSVNVGGSFVQDPILSAVMMPVPEPSFFTLLTFAGIGLLTLQRTRILRLEKVSSPPHPQ